MALPPKLSPEARAAALAKAAKARQDRAKVRESIKSGALSFSQVLDRSEDPVIGRMRVITLLESLPGYGKAKAARLMEEFDISESRRVQGLGERQRSLLLERLG